MLSSLLYSTLLASSLSAAVSIPNNATLNNVTLTPRDNAPPIGYMPDVTIYMTVDGRKYALEYPWKQEHDRRATRFNHQAWWKGKEAAFCVHLKPGYRTPGTPFRSFLGARCEKKIRQDLNNPEIGDDNLCWMDEEKRYSEYKIHDNLRNGWDSPEDCRRGCNYYYRPNPVACNRYIA